MGRTIRKGCSFIKRINEVNAIYDKRIKAGVTNREIWIKDIYPKYGICERTFYTT